MGGTVKKLICDRCGKEIAVNHGRVRDFGSHQEHYEYCSFQCLLISTMCEEAIKHELSDYHKCEYSDIFYKEKAFSYLEREMADLDSKISELLDVKAFVTQLKHEVELGKEKDFGI
jgi:hypothetical protein